MRDLYDYAHSELQDLLKTSRIYVWYWLWKLNNFY